MTATLTAGVGDVLDFGLPAELVATEPPEARGLARDEVRLLVSGPQSDRQADPDADRLTHATARDLPRFLRAGDLLVVNVSATLPAAVPAGDRMVHLSTPLPGGLWLVEVRRRADAGSLPLTSAVSAGERIELPGGAAVRLLSPYPAGTAPGRLWVAALDLPAGPRPVGPEPPEARAGGGMAAVHAWLERHGRPIRYGAGARPWPLAAYQTPYATEPGSAEMPSAGRALTPELLTALMARGVGVTPLVLHTGVSSQEAGEPPYPELYRVGAETAERVNAAHAAGRRVVAVGTTVTRALETVAGPDGTVHPGHGWTDLVVTPARGVRAVDGILTGWHDPRASHLAMLEAVAGPPPGSGTGTGTGADAGRGRSPSGRERLARCYAAALAERYRWHEFGDLLLLLR